MDWVYKDKTISHIGDIPEDAIGFVYLIEFEDGSKYVGKKNLYSKRTVASRKDGKLRPNAIDRIYKNTGKGFRKSYDIVVTESDWKTYQGSSVLCVNKIPLNKYILEYAYTPLELTYIEAKYLFKFDTITDAQYLNDNILGSFYRGSLDDYSRRLKKEKEDADSKDSTS